MGTVRSAGRNPVSSAVQDSRTDDRGGTSLDGPFFGAVPRRRFQGGFNLGTGTRAFGRVGRARSPRAECLRGPSFASASRRLLQMTPRPARSQVEHGRSPDSGSGPQPGESCQVCGVGPASIGRVSPSPTGGGNVPVPDMKIDAARRDRRRRVKGEENDGRPIGRPSAWLGSADSRNSDAPACTG